MQLTELTLAQGKHLASNDWKRITTIRKWLLDQGFTQLGKGEYGSVWTDDHRAVVKVFRNDACYIKFVEFCRANRGNPHLPRISKVFPYNRNSGVVFMEPLQRVDPNSIWIKQIGRYFFTRLEGQPYPHREQLYARFPKLVETLDQLSALLSKGHCSPDLHLRNIMQRGSTLVIIDPVST